MGKQVCSLTALEERPVVAGLVSVVKSGCREVWIASGGNSTMHSIFFFVLDSTLCSVATTSHKGVKDSRQSTLHSKKPCVQAADSRESWLGGTLGYTEKSSLREENKNITSNFGRDSSPPAVSQAQEVCWQSTAVATLALSWEQQIRVWAVFTCFTNTVFCFEMLWVVVRVSVIMERPFRSIINF